MVFGLLMLVALYIFYVLLIKGWLWKIILGAAGWYGMYWYLSSIPAARACPLVFSGHSYSWAAILPTLVIIFAMATTKED